MGVFDSTEQINNIYQAAGQGVPWYTNTTVPNDQFAGTTEAVSGPANVAYDAAAARRASDYAAATGALDREAGRIDPQLNTAKSNIIDQFTSAINKLLLDKSRAERDYTTSTDRAKQGRQETVASIDQSVSNQNTGIRRLLGSRGAGASSAARILAPYAVGQVGNQQRGQVQRTYGQNMQDIDTKRGDYLQDWDTKRGETDSWRANEERTAEQRAAQARLKIAEDRRALDPYNAGAYNQNIQSLIGQIDALNRVATYTPPTVAYRAPEMKAYGYDPATGPTTSGGASAVEQNVGPYYTLLGEEQKKEGVV